MITDFTLAACAEMIFTELAIIDRDATHDALRQVGLDNRAEMIFTELPITERVRRIDKPVDVITGDMWLPPNRPGGSR